MTPAVLAPAGAPPAWLARRDPRLRLLGTVAFALVTVSLPSLAALAGALALALAMALASGLGAAVLLRRLLLLEGFMVVVLLSLPFTVPGEVMAVAGPLTATWDGLERAIAIVLKANAIVVMLLALIGTLEPTTLGRAMARLGVPPKVAHLFLLTARYIEVLQDEYRRLRLAMRARAFRAGSNRHSWRAFGWLLGMVLVRSLERSRRIVAAMRCRGFQGQLYILQRGAPWQGGDTAAAAAGLALLGALLAWGHLP